MARTETGKADSKVKRQARTLQACLAKLLEPPMELLDGHPLPDVELSPREIRVLFLLGERGEMIMTDLAAALPAPLSTVTRIIDRMETKELVQRARSTEDRRIVVVQQAPKGRLMHDRFLSSQLQVAERMLEPLSNGEREILLELLGKLSRQI
ncbi:MarR family winged helix-turn-helix transcriptional regulator [Paludibaculum fermentans]|uniref:MarR family transcriptional regulator n=1 Tax=Paludibaculum fermentans TaxID=1473598 RepID=A0A7S7SN24_PALFE|nr:MarR family transcriptional regulator [Paludibaculum fermentans]QOY90533.1 MarR family transcriptional regulator [Paludibaculum fermentans]